MRQRRLGKMEHSEDVGAEGLHELLGRDVGEILSGVLFGCIVDEDVEVPERAQRLGYGAGAELAVADIAPEKQTAAAFGLNKGGRARGVTSFIEIDDCDVSTFFRKMDRDGFADAGVAAGDERRFALELARRSILPSFGLRAGTRISASIPGCFACTWGGRVLAWMGRSFIGRRAVEAE